MAKPLPLPLRPWAAVEDPRLRLYLACYSYVSFLSLALLWGARWFYGFSLPVALPLVGTVDLALLRWGLLFPFLLLNLFLLHLLPAYRALDWFSSPLCYSIVVGVSHSPAVARLWTAIVVLPLLLSYPWGLPGIPPTLLLGLAIHFSVGLMATLQVWERPDVLEALARWDGRKNPPPSPASPWPYPPMIFPPPKGAPVHRVLPKAGPGPGVPPPPPFFPRGGGGPLRSYGITPGHTLAVATLGLSATGLHLAPHGQCHSPTAAAGNPPGQ